MRSSPGEEVYHASEQVVEVGARRGCVRQESSDISPLAPYFQTSALTVMEAAISPFSLEEVKSSVYLTAKIPGIPPGPSLNIPKRLDYSPQSELLSLNAKATAHVFKPVCVWGGLLDCVLVKEEHALGLCSGWDLNRRELHMWISISVSEFPRAAPLFSIRYSNTRHPPGTKGELWLPQFNYQFIFLN